MAVTVERLIATLEARFDKYERSLNKALGNTDRTFTRIERRGKQLEARMASIGGNVSRSFFGAFAAGVSLKGAQNLMDTATRIENALKVAGLSGQDLTRVYDELFASAQKNAVPLEAMVTLYSRVAQAQDALKVSQDEMTNFTDKIGAALRVSGASAQEASGALLQLSQALGAGIVRAEEFNSINDGARPILQAVAAGLKEAGGSVAQLRALVVDGKVSSEAFFRAFEAGAYILEDKLAGSEMTVSQAFVRLQNVLIDTAGEMNEGTGATEKLVEVLDYLSTAIADTDFSPIISGIVEFGGHVVSTIGMIEDMARALGDLTGASNFGEWFYGKRDEMNAQSRIEGAFAGTVATKGDRVGGGKPLEVTVERGQISLDDYAVPDKKKKKKKKGARERADEYERLAKRITDSTAATIAETEAQRNLNPLIEDYGYAVEKARAEQELLTAAKAAGKEVTPKLRAEIAGLAEQYAMATVEAAKLAEAQDKVRKAAEEANEFNKALMRGMVDGLIEGKNAADIFADALKKVGDRLLDLAFNSAFDPKPGGGFGWLGNLLSGISGSGAKVGLYHSGGVVGSPKQFKSLSSGLRSDEVPAILQRGEVVIPKGGAVSSTSSVSAPVNISIDARGADREALARVEGQLARLKADLPYISVAAINRHLKSNGKLG